MVENQFGENLKRLRKIQGETQEDLSRILGCEKSAISQYESGKRTPTTAIIEDIALHFHVTMDSLLHSDYSDLSAEDFNTILTLSKLLVFLEKILPLVHSEDAMRNAGFKRGVRLSQQLNEDLSKGGILPVSQFEAIYDSFKKADGELDNEPAAKANVLWSILHYWLSLCDVNKALGISNKLMSKKLKAKEFFIWEETDTLKSARAEYSAKHRSEIIELLSALKTSGLPWSELADYYLAMCYIYRLLDSDADLSGEIQSTVGIQMMAAFAELGNDYAQNYFVAYEMLLEKASTD